MTDQVEPVSASDFLIPRKAYLAFTGRGLFSTAAIKRFADELNVASGIVVGRLQHDQHIGFNQFNSLKRRFEFKESA